MIADAYLPQKPMTDVHPRPRKRRPDMRNIHDQTTLAKPERLMREHAVPGDGDAEAVRLLAHVDVRDHRHRGSDIHCRAIETSLTHRDLGIPLRGRSHGGHRQRKTHSRQGGEDSEDRGGISLYMCHSRPSFGWSSLTYSRSCFLP